MTLSSYIDGEYGINDVCLSIPLIVNAKGITSHLEPKITDDEVEKLRHSAQCLKDVINQVEADF